MTTCVVFVCNKAYLCSFKKTCTDIRTIGNYQGDITLIVGNDLRNYTDDFFIENNVQIVYFPDIQFDKYVWDQIYQIDSDGRTKTKIFQWHKLHLFQTYFKKWDYIFYLDCGMIIHRDISPMLELFSIGEFLAHSDAYPTFQWKLRDQFDKRKTSFYLLKQQFDLDVDYFQTGILLFHTNIIKQDTFIKLVQLASQFPISRTNEQGIMAVYFNEIWKPLPIQNGQLYYYDYCNRSGNDKYIITRV